ncbi:hypothetical protein LTS18_006676, partial [Coniosporium uncinatum]
MSFTESDALASPTPPAQPTPLISLATSAIPEPQKQKTESRARPNLHASSPDTLNTAFDKYLQSYGGWAGRSTRSPRGRRSLTLQVDDVKDLSFWEDCEVLGTRDV